jgi:tetratricopeptide (TPR) repeat protein
VWPVIERGRIMTGDIHTPDGDAYELAAALHSQGRIGEAEKAYLAALTTCPDHSGALHGLGVLYLQTGRTEAAISRLRKAAAVAGGTVTILNNLGVALCAAKRFAEAADVYRQALKVEPDSVSSLVNLGTILKFLGNPRDASLVLQHAVELAPERADVHGQLATVLVQCGDAQDALGHFEQAAALAPSSPQAHCDLAHALLAFGRAQDAVEHYRRALAIDPDSPAAICGLGEALGALDRHEEAISCFERAVALAPNSALAHFNRGTALTYLGRKTEAAIAFARAVELAPESPAFRRAMIGVEKVTAGNAHLKVLERMASDADRMAIGERIALHFALAKAYDDLGDHARAFAELRRGNAAKRSISRYKLQDDLDRFRALAATFTADFLAAHAGDGTTTEVPVFVIGMPRSGTTLIEHILASHPDVFGAGEQGILPAFINAGRAGRDFPAGVKDLTVADWSALGTSYAQELCALAPHAARIIDKLPLNFQLVGLIRLALPGARIIHVMRDPLDTCFSCHSVLFDDDLDFSRDLADLGHYYNGYRRLMDHWRAVLPPGAMLEIQYENLVADLEHQTRRLIDYCGLAWDERCLKFYETDRPVQTASALQVRLPLYNSSVGRAAHYAPWLAPLRRILVAEEES